MRLFINLISLSSSPYQESVRGEVDRPELTSPLGAGNIELEGE